MDMNIIGKLVGSKDFEKGMEGGRMEREERSFKYWLRKNMLRILGVHSQTKQELE